MPASANGYYAANGQWVAGSTSGHWENGRWVAGSATGHYMADGRWMAGEAMGHRDANGVWVADAQPGYYDSNGRWRAGPATGYYDTQGRWVATAASAGAYGSQANYESTDGRRDVRSREAWLEQRIQRNVNDGSLSRYDGDRALRELTSIRHEEKRMSRRHGQLRGRDEAYIQAKLDNLSARVRASRQD